MKVWLEGAKQITEAPGSMTPNVRSRIMAAVKGKNTKPEMTVRRLTHRLGYRFRLHRRDLPGSPDLVFPSKRKVIFVHGCFWHRHAGCSKSTTPKTRSEFWSAKFKANIERDARNIRDLDALGWITLVIWECDTQDLDALTKLLSDYLESQHVS